MSRPETITLSAAAGAAIIERLSVYAPSRSACESLIQVLRWYCWLAAAVQEAKLRLTKLRMLLWGHGPKPPTRCEPEASSRGDGEVTGDGSAREEKGERSTTAGAQPEAVASAAATSQPQGGPRPGPGRLGAEAYTGAERVECHHEERAVGQRCPVCGQGTVYALPPGVARRIDGQALRSARRYEVAKRRCSACGQIFTAGLPEGAGATHYSPQARAVWAVGRSVLGLPLSRIEAYQARLGVPVPEATQWDQIAALGDCAYQVLAQMEHAAAQGELIFHDDTAVRLLALRQENLALVSAAQAHGLSTPTARTGRHTTALVVKVGEHTAILSSSSRRHAGDHLQGLLAKREAGLDKPLAMSDALASNALPNAAQVIRCHCLAHGRRQFSDLVEVLPHACQGVLEVLSQVVDHDEQARTAQLSPAARLADHQAHSQPLVATLQKWLATQLDEHLGEPPSALGKAIGSRQRPWETLTRFLHVHGAPLANNLAERALKRCIRPRNNSLFYKNAYSASMASVLTSLMATCL